MVLVLKKKVDLDKKFGQLNPIFFYISDLHSVNQFP